MVDQTGAHDAVIGGEIFGAIGGEDGHAIAAREAAPTKRAGDAIRYSVEVGIADLARDLAVEIDDRNLAEIAIAPDEITEVYEARHCVFLGHQRGVAKQRVILHASAAALRGLGALPLPACGG
jgi:hypothetical protein